MTRSLGRGLKVKVIRYHTGSNPHVVGVSGGHPAEDPSPCLWWFMNFNSVSSPHWLTHGPFVDGSLGCWPLCQRRHFPIPAVLRDGIQILAEEQSASVF